MFSEAWTTFLVCIFSPPGFVAMLIVWVIRSFVSVKLKFDAFVGVLLNLPAVAYWISWLAHPSSAEATTNNEIGAILVLYIGFGGLGAGWIIGILFRLLARVL